MKTFTLLFVVCLYGFIAKGQTFSLKQCDVTTTVGDSRGANFIDINNDGWEDIFISNGAEEGQVNFLFLNDKKGNFSKITAGDITQYLNPSDGASFADYDNDGDVDGVVVSWYGKEDYFYTNDGKGIFDYLPDNGLNNATYAETAAFGDYDNDGWLDLYVTTSGGNKKNLLYRNLKNGKFEKLGNHVLVAEAKPSRGAIWTDSNNDGKIDLFVVNEGGNSKDLFIAQGNGNYTKASNQLTNSLKPTMTSSWGDIDNDGDMDAFLGTSGFYVATKNQLFVNEGNDYREITNTAISQIATCTYGSSFADYDNDGDLDLFVSNGFCNSALKNMLFENKGNLMFDDVSDKLLHNESICSFGAAWGDINNDGFLDILVANCKNDAASSESPSSLLVNSGNGNHWLKVILKGTRSNRNGIGAKIKIRSKIKDIDVWQVREIHSQSGYAGQNSIHAHFGIAEAAIIDSLIVLWPSGITQALGSFNSNQMLTVEEKETVSTVEQSELNQVQIKIGPNPIKSWQQINIYIESTRNYAKSFICITNAKGQNIFSKNIQLAQNSSTEVSINEGLESGLYYVTVYTDDRKLNALFTKKLIVE